ncbi:MAG: GNAT family N-acetyltransferase [Gemmatimonadaceae bacterium]|nr:GNAT family N-acetyltransferase [Gemmatimonadaceae bacterium]
MTYAPIIGPIVVDDQPQLLALAVATGLFTRQTANDLLQPALNAAHDATEGSEHRILASRAPDASRVTGWSYFARDPHAGDVWNVWWFGVHPHDHGTGVAQALLREVEHEIRLQGARVVVIETSDADALARARRFYERSGYHQCGTVPDFYGMGEGKVIYAKTLAR